MNNPYLLGIDVSKWQSGVNWEYAKTQGVKYAFIKAQEWYWTDNQFFNHWSGSGAVGMPRGAYLYYRDALVPETQAQKFYELLVSTGDLGELPPVLDVESYNNPTLTPAKVKKCLETLSALFGRAAIFYSRNDVIQTLGNPAWLLSCPLWLAQYTLVGWQTNHFEKVKQYPPTIPAPYPFYSVWQFSDKCPAITFQVTGSTTVDTNYAPEEIINGWTGTTPPPDPIGEIVFPETYVTATVTALPAGMNYRNCRTKPDSTGGDAGLIEGKVYLAQSYPCWQSVNNAEGIWYLVELPDKSFGWVLGVMPSGVVYITLTQDPIPPVEGEPMTPEQLARLEAVEVKTTEHESEITALQNTPPGTLPMTHKVVTTQPNGEKLHNNPDSGEHLMLANGTEVRLLSGKVWKGMKLYGLYVGGLPVWGWLPDSDVVQL